MPFTFAAVHTFASKLPSVTVGTSWNHRTWFIGKKGFVWQRPLGKADIKRYGELTPPSGEILAVLTENLDAKDALLAMELQGFFTIEHFNGYPAVLIELRKARAADVRHVIESAYHVAFASKPVRAPRPTSPTRGKRTLRKSR